MLDGYSVSIGDVVFVLGIGAGTVTSTNMDGGFTVRAGTGETYYRSGGFVGNQRRVYWADPVMVIPPKNPRKWKAFNAVVRNLWEQCDTFYKLGEQDEHAANES